MVFRAQRSPDSPLAMTAPVTPWDLRYSIALINAHQAGGQPEARRWYLARHRRRDRSAYESRGGK
jgi:hypothetical protein